MVDPERRKRMVAGHRDAVADKARQPSRIYKSNKKEAAVYDGAVLANSK